MQIIESAACVEQFRFPRSKKKRIRAKWSKRHENFRPAHRGYVIEGKFICHPVMAAKLRRAMAQHP